jgi:hypothetical protein
VFRRVSRWLASREPSDDSRRSSRHGARSRPRPSRVSTPADQKEVARWAAYVGPSVSQRSTS